MWPWSQDPLQHAEGISLSATYGGTLTGDQRVDQVIISMYSQLPWASTHKPRSQNSGPSTDAQIAEHKLYLHDTQPCPRMR